MGQSKNKLFLLVLLMAISTVCLSKDSYDPFIELKGRLPAIIEKLTKQKMSLSSVEKELGKKAQRQGSNYYFDLDGEKQNFIIEVDIKNKIKTVLFKVPKRSRPDERFFKHLYESYTEKEKKDLEKAREKNITEHEAGRYITLPLKKRKISFKFKDNSNKSLISIKVMP